MQTVSFVFNFYFALKTFFRKMTQVFKTLCGFTVYTQRSDYLLGYFTLYFQSWFCLRLLTLKMERSQTKGLAAKFGRAFVAYILFIICKRVYAWKSYRPDIDPRPLLAFGGSAHLCNHGESDDVFFVNCPPKHSF